MPEDPTPSAATPFDHPIFTESLRTIRVALTSLPGGDPLLRLSPLQQEVALRLIHSSGDLQLVRQLRFSAGACSAGLTALAAQAPLLTDTAMAAAGVAPMARRTFGNAVHSVLEWAPDTTPPVGTRTAIGMRVALDALPGAVVLIGSAPTALEQLLQLVAEGRCVAPALVVGMPVGFVGVAESKRHLAETPQLPQIRLDGSRGGAALTAAVANALLRRAWLDRL